MISSSNAGIALPLSSAQYEIWLVEQQIGKHNRVYNTGVYFDIDGPVDPVVFEVALRQVIGEIQAVQVRFVQTRSGPRQMLHPVPDWMLPVVDVGDDPDPLAAAHAWMSADLARPMDLARGPLFRYGLLKLGPEHFVWYQAYHHIVMDEYGYFLVAHRMAQVYNALISGKPCPPHDFGSLREVIDDDRAYRESEQYARDQAYWVKRFADRPEPTRLVPRSSTIPEHLIDQNARPLPPGTDALAAVARPVRAPWFYVVIAATGLYVHRITGARDVTVGFPVTARQGRVLQQTPGMVSNVLPLRLSLGPDMTVRRLIAHVAEEICGALAHQRYRGEDIYRDLDIAGSITTSFAPLVNIVSFDYALHFGGYRATARHLSFGMISDLFVVAWDKQDGSRPKIGWHAHPEVCSAEELAAHHHRFLTLLDTLSASDPDVPIGGIGLLIPAERDRLLIEYNDSTIPVPVVCLPELFQQQVTCTPDNTAVVCGDVT
ncbi:MAG: non-ribosomal peptide synthetase, partial [Pseudonocardiales bacterium]|nr:non-ribosomal peptide synthetase [Pseudonocardiales bacterium]